MQGNKWKPKNALNDQVLAQQKNMKKKKVRVDFI